MNKQSILLLVILFSISYCYGQSNLYKGVDYDYGKLDSTISKQWKNNISTDKNLPYPYVTGFLHQAHMYYWDTYFINKGLLATGHLKEAKQNTLNLLSVVDRFGFMGNAAVTSWGMNRSQPPYLSVMVRDIFEVEKDTQFLRYAYPLLKKEYKFWTDKSANAIESHDTSIPGLERFGHHATSTELIDLYNHIFERLGLDSTLSDAQKIIIASPYAAEAETGMDFTLRFEGHCPDFVAVDLNSLLYRMEINLAWITAQLHITDSFDWSVHAKKRKDLINKYCWDEQSGMYYDFNFITGKRSKVAAATAFQPLWAGIATPDQARRVADKIWYFQSPFGLTTTAADSKDEKRQWGCLSVWAPMQLIAVDGLRKYGLYKEASEVANGFMLVVAKNYYSPAYSMNAKFPMRKTGDIYEKYKSDGSINDDEYTSNVMMGWTGAVYNYFYRLAINKK